MKSRDEITEELKGLEDIGKKFLEFERIANQPTNTIREKDTCLWCRIAYLRQKLCKDHGVSDEACYECGFDEDMEVVQIENVIEAGTGRRKTIYPCFNPLFDGYDRHYKHRSIEEVKNILDDETTSALIDQLEESFKVWQELEKKMVGKI
jgi:hypothetical protein